MTDILVTSPFRPFTLPNQFKAVFNGYIYCGTVDAVDPSVSQVQVYLVNESGDKVPVAQPLRTNAGGFLVYNGQPAKFVTSSNHSLLVRDSLGNQVWYEPDMASADPETLRDDIYDNFTREFDSVADMVAATDLKVGQKVRWLGYYSAHDGGGNSGIVISGPLIDDGGSVFVTSNGFVVEASHKETTIRAKTFGIRADFVTDNKPQLSNLWNFAPQGSEITYPAGYIRVVGGLVHPLKVLTHTGTGLGFSWAPSPTRMEGTAFYFTGVVPGAGTKGGFYMPPSTGGGVTCRFSTFRDLSLFGDGDSDDTGTVTCLQINNNGTHLDNVLTRYGRDGIEVNYSVNANWNNVEAFASRWAIVHKKDPALDFGSDKNSVATLNNYNHIAVHTGLANPDAIGWYIDATCSYGSNTHGGSFDCESCVTGMVIEGRVAAKDYASVQVFGAAAWKGAGNIFDAAWFERNSGGNIKIVFDAGAAEPALLMRGVYQDTAKIATTSDIQTVLAQPNGLVPLVPGTAKDKPQGVLGNWGSPFTGSQYLLHGMTGNFPLTRTILNEKICRKLGSRTSADEKGGYSWSFAKDDLPGLDGAINIANLNFMSDYKTAIVEYKASCITNTGGAYFVTGKLAVSNVSGNISYIVIPGTDSFQPANIKAVELRALEVSDNTFGLFVFKHASITSVLRVTIDLDYTISASHTGDRRTTLTTFEV